MDANDLSSNDNGFYDLPVDEKMNVGASIVSTPKLLSTVDDGALEQVRNVACLPGIVGKSLGMPDMHIGYGFCVGGVSAFDAQEGIISPGGIGFDINCGVRLLASDVDEARLDGFVSMILDLFHEYVPAGVGKKSSFRLSKQQLDEVLKNGANWALANGYASQEDIDRTESFGYFSQADPSKVSSSAKKRGMSQLGTLGAGNHFLELQVVDEVIDLELASAFGLEKGKVCVMIHCGSRGMGHQVCTDTLRLIAEQTPDLLASLPEKNLAYAPIGSKIASNYLGAMHASANFAFCNRQVIAHQVRQAFKRLVPEASLHQVYDVAHNIAKKEEHLIDGVQRPVWVHRKGATRAFPAGHPDLPDVYAKTGHPVLIPGSMGTASYVLVGTQGAMDKTFGSSAHGAGRVMSRTKAKQDISYSSVMSSLKNQNVIVKAATRSGIVEEAPAVYKDVDEVVRATESAGIAKRVARLRPLGVVKG